MADITLSILKPSVNNLTVRIFVRAAGLDFQEVDVWGQTTTPSFLSKDPAHLTPMIEDIYPLNDALAAFDYAAGRGVLKVLLRP